MSWFYSDRGRLGVKWFQLFICVCVCQEVYRGSSSPVVHMTAFLSPNCLYLTESVIATLIHLRNR